MTSHSSPDDDRAKLRELVEDFRTAMVATCAPDNEIHARPLTIAEVSDDGVLYFPTGITTEKIAEIAARPSVNVTLQSGRKFVSISGRADVRRDRALIDRLWSDAWKVWFPNGKDDPELAILAVRPHEAEYWDESGTRGLRYLFAAAKALAKGTTPRVTDEEQHAKVRM